MKNKKYATYVKKSFVMIKMEKKNLNYTKKLEITVITLENLEEQLIVLFKLQSTLRNFCSNS